jgi:phytoene dehydrogenase-like protein
VRLTDGTEVSAPVVLSNSDPQRTFLGLVGREELPPDLVRRLEQIHSDTGYFKLHWACHGLPEWKALDGDDLSSHHFTHDRIC